MNRKEPLINNFTLKTRIWLEFLLKTEKKSLTEISTEMKISRSSISREIKRNSHLFGYDAYYAQEKCEIRNQWKKHCILKSHMHKYDIFSQIFHSKFNKRSFGIDVTYQYIKNTQKVQIPALRTVFNWIESGVWVISRKDCLRSKYRKKHPDDYKSGVEKLVGKRWIRPFWSRPTSIAERSEYGHWEVDLIIGRNRAKHSHLLIFTERITRYGIIILLPEKNPWKINRLLWDTIKKYKLNVKSITQDNGWEFKSLFI
ncbi:IS30 family transposase [Mycoplasma sp. 6243]|uniref:IS30 family transposase n=1 Tax=Mycoplasma sp. 6243 TaxID=3440865 RepID=UPI003EBE3C3F